MKKQLFSSMHTHTIFCDGKDSITSMCEAAYEKKMHSIGFSAHAPISKRLGMETDWHIKEDSLCEYIEEVLKCKQKWKGKFFVFLGLEVDYIKGIRSALDSDIISLNLDYIIGSVHYVIPPNNTQPFAIDSSQEEFIKGLNEGFNGDAELMMHHYYNAVTEMTILGGFDILGHADLIKKNSHNKNYWEKETEKICQKEIANAAFKAGITAEVNTGGLNRGKTNDVFPSLQFLRFFCEHNVPVIITSDAHNSKHIDGNYDTAIQTLIHAGYKEHSLFLGRQNNKPLWKKRKL